MDLSVPSHPDVIVLHRRPGPALRPGGLMLERRPVRPPGGLCDHGQRGRPAGQGPSSPSRCPCSRTRAASCCAGRSAATPAPSIPTRAPTSPMRCSSGSPCRASSSAARPTSAGGPSGSRMGEPPEGQGAGQAPPRVRRGAGGTIVGTRTCRGGREPRASRERSRGRGHETRGRGGARPGLLDHRRHRDHHPPARPVRDLCG